ncbi:hypothetical protein DFH07DRAFT_957249 [Mycena maculata]|uniref:Protein kinase domain-containing protein n=1 Tax=Mycena maculata TaxID=230809 RepID=A0AAD7NHE5_9AGAR|nr:hypothetical protein DFH07DRAFT_957249 [Mycena maculata]
MTELFTWAAKYQSHVTEVLAYRYLHALQGTTIPRLYGIVPPPHICCYQCIYLAVDFVNGLAISLIEGTPMGALCVGRNLTEDRAEEVSQCILDLVQTLQAQRCLHLHNDIAFHNIILCNGPHVVDPVLINFGIMEAQGPGELEPMSTSRGHPSIFGFKIYSTNSGSPTHSTNLTPGHSLYFNEVETWSSLMFPEDKCLWHIVTPLSQHVNEEDVCIDGIGFLYINNRLQYEHIPGTDGSDVKNTIL